MKSPGGHGAGYISWDDRRSWFAPFSQEASGAAVFKHPVFQEISLFDESLYRAWDTYLTDRLRAAVRDDVK